MSQSLWDIVDKGYTISEEIVGLKTNHNAKTVRSSGMKKKIVAFAKNIKLIFQKKTSAKRIYFTPAMLHQK